MLRAAFTCWVCARYDGKGLLGWQNLTVWALLINDFLFAFKALDDCKCPLTQEQLRRYICWNGGRSVSSVLRLFLRPGQAHLQPPALNGWPGTAVRRAWPYFATQEPLSIERTNSARHPERTALWQSVIRNLFCSSFPLPWLRRLQLNRCCCASFNATFGVSNGICMPIVVCVSYSRYFPSDLSYPEELEGSPLIL